MKKSLSVFLSIVIMLTSLLGFGSTALASTKTVSKNTVISKWHICTLVEYKQPTCTDKGYKLYKCRLCSYTTKTIILAKGHTTVVDEAVEPTCTTVGLTEGEHCSTCGEVLTPQETLAKTEHNFGANLKTCTVCGAQNPNYVSTSTTNSNPRIISLKNAQVRGFTLTYNSSPNYTLYQIQYSTSVTFATTDVKTININNNFKVDKNVSKTITNLLPNKTYYVRIRGKNSAGLYTAYSNFKSIKISS